MFTLVVVYSSLLLFSLLQCFSYCFQFHIISFIWQLALISVGGFVSNARMPPGRRRVRCPGCQVGLEEPENSSVYECPVCSILLKAKGPKVHSELERNPNGDKHHKTVQEKCQLESGNEDSDGNKNTDHPGDDTKENICENGKRESTEFIAADEKQTNSRSNSRGNKVLQELRLVENRTDVQSLASTENNTTLEQHKQDDVLPEGTKTIEEEPYFDRSELETQGHYESEENMADSETLKETHTAFNLKSLPNSNPPPEEDGGTCQSMDNQESYSEFSFPTLLSRRSMPELDGIALSHENSESVYQIQYTASGHNGLHLKNTVNHNDGSSNIEVHHLEVDASEEGPVRNGFHEREESFDASLPSPIRMKVLMLESELDGKPVDAIIDELWNTGSCGIKTLDTQDQNEDTTMKNVVHLSCETSYQSDDVQLEVADGEKQTSDVEVGCDRTTTRYGYDIAYKKSDSCDLDSTIPEIVFVETQNSVISVDNERGVEKMGVYIAHDKFTDGHHSDAVYTGTQISDTVAEEVDDKTNGRPVNDCKMPNPGVVFGYDRNHINDGVFALCPAYQGSVENHSYYSDTTKPVVTDCRTQNEVIINDDIVLEHETQSENSSSDIDAMNPDLAGCEMQNSDQAYAGHLVSVHSETSMFDLTSVNDSETMNDGNDSATCDRHVETGKLNTSESTTVRREDSDIPHETKLESSDVLVCIDSYSSDAMKIHITCNSTTHYSNVLVGIENEAVLVYHIKDSEEALQTNKYQFKDIDVATHYREFYGYYTGLANPTGSSEEEREAEDNENYRQHKKQYMHCEVEDSNGIDVKSQLNDEDKIVAVVDDVEFDSEIEQNDSDLNCPEKEETLHAPKTELHQNSRDMLLSRSTDEAGKSVGAGVNRESLDIDYKKATVNNEAEEMMSDAVNADFTVNAEEANSGPGLALEPANENSILPHANTTKKDVSLEQNIKGPSNPKPHHVKGRNNRGRPNFEDCNQQQSSVTMGWIEKSENDEVDGEDLYKPVDQSFRSIANEDNQTYLHVRPNVDAYLSGQQYGSIRHPNSVHLAYESEMPNARTQHIRYQSSETSLPMQGHAFTDYQQHCIHPACVLCCPYQHLHVPQHQRLPCAVCLSHLLPMAYHPEPYQHTVKRSPLGNHTPVANRHKPSLQPIEKQGCHPPFPQRGGMPYVLCKYCNTLLEVPAYFSLSNHNARKLRCGVCLKVTKFAGSKSPSLASIDAASSIAVSENSNSVSQGTDHSRNVSRLQDFDMTGSRRFDSVAINQMAENNFYVRHFSQDGRRLFHSQSFDVTQPKACNATALRQSINGMSDKDLDLRQSTKKSTGFHSQALMSDTEKKPSSIQQLSSSRNYSSPLSKIEHQTDDPTPYTATPEDYQRYILKGKQKIDESEPVLSKFHPYSSNSLASSLQSNHSAAISGNRLLPTLDSYKHSRDQISYQFNDTSPSVIEIQETLPRTSSISEERSELQYWGGEGTSSSSPPGRYKVASTNESQRSRHICKPSVSTQSVIYTDDSSRSSLLDLFNKESTRFRLNTESFENARSFTWSRASASSPRHPTSPYHHNREQGMYQYPAPPANIPKGSPVNLIKKTLKHLSKGHHSYKVRT